MGRPALINRTGQFSNSAELVSLRDTGRTITGEYTYTLTGGGTSKINQECTLLLKILDKNNGLQDIIQNL